MPRPVAQDSTSDAQNCARVQVLSEEYLIRRTITCFHLVTHATIDALGGAPDILARVVPYSTVTEAEAALQHKLRSQLQGLQPEMLEAQLMPAFELASSCRDYAATVHLQPGFNRTLLKQAISNATTSHGPASAECLAICALEAVRESALQQLQKWATLTHDQALTSAFDGAAHTSRRSPNLKRGLEGIDRRQQGRGYADQRPRAEDWRSGAVSSKVKDWARDIQHNLASNERVCFKYLENGRSCATHRRCAMAPCNGKEPEQFRQAERQARRGG